jgi:ribosomal protein S18 acetylase RimI-like enzyme
MQAEVGSWRQDSGTVVTVRSASAADSDFLQRMLVVAAGWRPDVALRPVEDVLADPALAHYVVGWPRHDDFGIIAEDSRGERLGAAWCRYFSAEDPGYGFVSPDVPELSMGVVAEARGAGVGRSLLVVLIAEARIRGISQLSLSVELDNYARHLYSSLGFRVTAEGDGSATMVLMID